MGSRLSVDEGNGLAVSVLFGAVDDAGLRAWYSQLRLTIEALGLRGCLIDFSQVVSFDVSTQAVLALASEPPLGPPGVIRVAVAPQNVVYGLARMFRTIGAQGRADLHIVRSYMEACGLLAIERLADTDELRCIE